MGTSHVSFTSLYFFEQLDERSVYLMLTEVKIGVPAVQVLRFINIVYENVFLYQSATLERDIGLR